MLTRSQASHKRHVMFYFTLCVYCCFIFAAVSIFASPAQINDIAVLPPDSPEVTAASPEPLNVEAIITSEKRLDFDDIYAIALKLELAGSVEVNAVNSDEINIRLKKRGRGLDENSVRQYLETVELSVSKTEDMLTLAPRLPAASDSRSELTRLDCFIQTPPDVSLNIRTQNGDIHVNCIRGDIELEAAVGKIRLNETMGRYKVYSGEGDIHCEILLTDQTNRFETALGAINLVVLDEIAAPTNLTAKGGGITLRLPKSFQADVEIQTKSRDPRAVSINVPVEVEKSFEGDSLYGWINGGGPLFQLNAADKIEILPLGTASVDDETSLESAKDRNEVGRAQPVPKALQSPVIDGNLFEKAWSKAVALSPFYRADGATEPDEPTQAFLMWDEQRLYIGIKVYSDEMGRLRISQTETGSAVWKDDSIEILADPNPETEPYYHLVINPIGTLFSQVVKSDYPPDYRFAPMLTKHEKNAKRGFKFKIARNSQAQPNQKRIGDSSNLDDAKVKIETQITSRYWSVEIALRRDILEPELTGNWRLNLHRKAQKNGEFSYWMPTYDTETPWWPHNRDQMGRLHFTSAGEESELFEIEDELEIGKVEIKGNSEIPTSEIVQRIPFHIGEVITSSQLSWLAGELGEHPWFRKARLDTVPFEVINGEAEINPPETDVDASSKLTQPATEVGAEMDGHNTALPLKLALRIHVTEIPSVVRQKFDLKGNTHFQSATLRKWLGLTRGRTPIEDLNVKSQLITELYRNHGYELARTKEVFTPRGLTLVIDEGRLDEVRFTGNDRIKRHELTQTLRLQVGEVHNILQTQKQISRMREKLAKHNAIFKDVRDWQARREKGKNVLIINIEERAPVRLHVSPRVRFNRVHGLILGGSGDVSTEAYVKGRIFGSASIGFSSSIKNYQLGAEKPWFDTRELRIGGTWYKLTGVVHNALTYLGEGSLSSIILGKAFLDFYQRRGYQTWLTQKLTTSSEITLSFTDELHENLLTSTDWSLFSRDHPKRGNARIDEGTARSVEFSYHFDSRDYKLYSKRPFRLVPWPSEHTTQGWRNSFSVEYSSNRFNSDFDFTLCRFEVARYNRLPNGHNLDFRVMGGLSDSPLPRQRLLYADRTHILRGFGFNRFIGDNMLALNVEYRVVRRLGRISKDKAVNGAVSIFFDAGDAWFDHERFSRARVNASIGMGFSLFTNAMPYEGIPDTLRVEIVRALERRHTTNVVWRLWRNF